MRQRIVIVDDDARLRNRLRAYLEQEGFEAVAVDGGEALRAFLAERPADLVILDLMMPGEDGLSLTRYLREHFDVGILILTGKGDTVDRIVGLEMGADDYLGKPFNLRELLARVRSVLRRSGVAEGTTTSKGPAAEGHDVIAFDRFRLDRTRRRLTVEGGEEIHLTSAEYDLLIALVTRPNRPMTRDQLLDAVAGRGWEPFDRSIDLHISHLRKKLEADPKRPEIIKTVRGAGYVFTSPVAPG